MKAQRVKLTIFLKLRAGSQNSEVFGTTGVDKTASLNK
jgi:hypothetical protein